MLPERAEYQNFSHYGNALFIVLLVTIFFCIPVSGAIGTSIGNTTSVPAIKNATDYENQGKVLMAERDWSGVINSTNEGLRFYPYNPELLCLQGYALRKTGHYQESVDLISLAIPNDTRPVRYANRGYGYLAMGNAPDAIRDADSALSLNSSYTTAYALKASALQKMGNISAAGDTIEKALIFDPDNAYYLQVKGGILADSGDCAGAIDAYRHSITINPDYDQPWPGLPNATEDLKKTDMRCAAMGVQTSPTSAAFPASIVFLAGIIALVIVLRQPR